MEIVKIVMNLFPGFLAYFLIGSCIHRKKQSQIQEIFEAFFHIIFIYFIQNLIYNNWLWLQKNINEVISVFFITIIYSLMVIFILERDYIFRFLRYMKFTTKSLLPSVWIQTFKSEANNWITLRMTDGTEIYGYPQYYSDTSDETAIYLIYPHWVERDENGTKYIEVGIKGIFFHDFSKIEFIQFHEEEE